MQQARLNPQHINFKKERNFSEKLDATFAFLRQDFKPMAKNILFIAGPFALLTGLFYGVFQSFTGFSGQVSFENNPNFFLLIIGLVGFIFFSFLAGPLVTAIVFRHIRAYIAGQTQELETSYMWKTIWKEFFSVLGTSLFIGLLFIVSIVILAIPAGLFSVLGNPLMTGLLMFLFMFILMFAMCGFLLLFPIRSMEGVGVFSATARMFRIISGKWLSTIGLVIVTSLITMVISMFLTIPSYIIMFMKGLHGGEFDIEAVNSSPLYTLLISIFTGLSMVGAYSLYSILFVAITFQYFNLVERKDSSGLMERMESFGKVQPVNEDHEEQY